MIISTLSNRTFPMLAAFAWLQLAQNAMAAPPDGETLAQRWCAQCHGVGPGQKSANDKAPPFAEVAARQTTTVPSLKVFLRSPHENMPNLMLQTDEINLLVDYIVSLKPKL
jgi:cytochrome c